MNLYSFTECPICNYSCKINTEESHMYNYISCDNCIRKVFPKNSSTGDIVYNISRYSINAIHSDLFLIKIEKNDDQIISIDLNKNIPDIKLNMMNPNDFSVKRDIKIPFDGEIYSSINLIKIINIIDKFQFLL